MLSQGRPAAFASILATLFVVSERPAHATQLVLRADRDEYVVGQVAQLGLYAVSDGSDVELSGVQGLLTWTPENLMLQGVDLGGVTGLAYGGFSVDPFGVNEVAVPSDGTAIFVALVALDQSISTSPAGTLLGTFQFQVLRPFEDSIVALDGSAGTPPVSSAIFGTVSPNLPLALDCGEIALEATGCVGDLDGNQQVDLIDLSILLAHYGSTTATLLQGDLDGDADVDLSDLAGLLALYGESCRQ